MVSIPIRTVNPHGDEEDALLITLLYSSHKVGTHIFFNNCVCRESVHVSYSVHSFLFLSFTDDVKFKYDLCI